jgi:REP element-mobilizing transposase RayT
MSQSLANLMVHVVFNTKNRSEWINSDIESRLFAYLRGIAENINAPIIEIGGMPDHIHLLMHLSRSITLANNIQRLKTASSRFIKEIAPQLHDFSWQRGYGAFSVSPSSKLKVMNYIKNQKEHHLNGSFKDEFRILLTKHEIHFDEKYLWD